MRLAVIWHATSHSAVTVGGFTGLESLVDSNLSLMTGCIPIAEVFVWDFRNRLQLLGFVLRIDFLWWWGVSSPHSLVFLLFGHIPIGRDLVFRGVKIHETNDSGARCVDREVVCKC